MDIKLTIPPEIIDQIADRVIEKLKPLLDNRKQDDDTFMTIEETAGYLKTKKAQIYQWVHNSQHGLSDFPYLKRGKRLLFSKKALIKWLKTHSKPL